MKKRKGFTLIELLAVIVILGLLMAIAIPSVTKYITESRKKTVVSTIGNYMTAMINEVNDLNYTFTEANTIYAVPIECIALERGGTNPFGAWHQASNAYWAYVLVQYDDEKSSYTYGYTFKDSAGYGLYPTAQSKLNEQGKQIQTGLSLSRPKNGKVTTITELKNWNGFIVDENTDFIVLESATEGEIGDGKNSCTLQQKGTNYENVEKEKDEKYAIGKEVCFDSIECFYIVDSDVNNVYMLTKSRIDMGKDVEIPTQNTPQEAKRSAQFSSTPYWSGSKKYVYDENCLFYDRVETYKKYLEEKFNINISNIGMISWEQLQSLGCNNRYACANSPHKEKLVMGYHWWTGFAYSEDTILLVQNDLNFTNYPPTNVISVRPVITVPKSELNI